MTPLSSPFFLAKVSISQVMGKVLLALIPGIVAYVYFFGPLVLFRIVFASIAAIAFEALILKIRQRPILPYLCDLSAIVTAFLLVLAFPPFVPWWLTVVGIFFAIVITKHLYGGLGQNPFNPAMVGFAVCIVSFPALMAQWPPAMTEVDFVTQLKIVFGVLPRIDALAGATALDTLKTGLKLAGQQSSVMQVVGSHPGVFGFVGSFGWEWVSIGYLVGGLWLLQQRIFSWHVPAIFLLTFSVIATLLWLYAPEHFASPLFHLFAGATMLGAFFIATDPVTCSTTPKGKLIFAMGAAALAYIIRVFGGYPDGIAFAIILMNLCVPIIDLYTKPPIFGLKKEGKNAD